MRIRRTVTLAWSMFTVAGGGAGAQTMSVQSDIHHDQSPSFHILSLGARPRAPAAPHPADPVRPIPLPKGLKLSSEPDGALQPFAFLAPQKRAPNSILNFPGLGQGVPNFAVEVSPPDTNGAVGDTQYVQWVNASFAVFDKKTGKLVSGGGPTSANALWAGFKGACETNDAGDGVVVFDKIAHRWVISQFVGDKAPYLQCVAVSTSSDATGTYNRYSFGYGEFNDYPKMGVWPDAYYVTFNMFNPDFAGANVCAYQRDAMLKGEGATQVCFQQTQSVGGLLPSDLDGQSLPPSGSPNYVVNFGSNTLNLFRFHVDFVNTDKSTFTGPTIVNVVPFTPLCDAGTCVPQPNVKQQLDSLADRMMFRLAYRNFGDHESLVTTHSVSAGKSGGVRWYEIRNPKDNPVIAQQGTFAPDSSYRWMGSIATDKMGDMALGYSISNSKSLHPSIAYTGRTPQDPVGTMETEVLVANGTASTTGLSRWGDYSAMQVDPVDDCTFWYTHEYMIKGGDYSWNTRIVSFRFPGCVTEANAPSHRAAHNN